ncbi:Enoyl-CoA isomerase/hydratase [Fulvia fulva]|uniref:Enoyl-CoA isomerase/hydratase n=1 Tax=Passalora fulva TaxID=5499 RepID=A0A9Q8PKE9_PASFU|nr:Enoyl-CoA isomerase/hydratase [Fulvia fulva]KAK4612148.1 Enoyl-CoA isomerase/hydratase [Fulvia fulva]KAK4612388.1 Enoyl-CoA isomerase/hydratase [Fulvia fulva]UJO24004.1 Enoyl-CoA isomerase/hydratase [Fulvia fulva]WPV21581.1 Enoyl-CoA isomerase/hydratase [Fulvia fulva]WPV36575.1 Enoyl-CoA isomerase/hydratase [Fulvia fulva]
MLQTARHQLARGGRSAFLQQYLKASSVRCYSSGLQSTIKLSSLQAPHSGEIAVLSLNRPKARNAISKQLLGELNRVVEQLHSEGAKSSTRALILASESDDAFCAGADLKERLTFSEDDTKDFLKTLRHTFHRLSTLPIPTISAISSTAFGGGLELALCTNFRVMSSTASIGLPETRLAIIPGAGGTYRLPALIGESRARDLILTGRRVSGEEAYFIGLCDRIVQIREDEQNGSGVARGKVLEQAVEMATNICEGGPVAIRAAMEAVNGWKKGAESENKAYEQILNTSDRTEALRAFGEKRKPAFKGR